MATFKDKLPPFDTAALGAVATARPDLNSRLLHGFILQVIGTGNPLITDYIDYILINQDDKQKCLIKPPIQLKLQNALNSNGDVFDPSCLYLPLTRAGQNWSPWGTADISQMSIQAKILGVNPAGKTLTKIIGYYAYTPVVQPQNRGDVYLQTVINVAVPVGGWNLMAGLPIKDIIVATKLLFNHIAITEVRISIGERLVYNMTRAVANESLRWNPLYHAENVGAETYFLAQLDDMGIANDFIPLVENGVRRPVNVEFFWDVTITPVPVAFDILVEGVEKGAPAPVAVARA